MNISFAGKRALITGAGQGIGRLLSKRLVECGAKVVGLSKTQANLDSLKAEVPEIETICVDVADWHATKAAVEAAGDFDILVNNAGTAVCLPIGEITLESIEKTFAVNITAPINISQIVAKRMKAQGKGGAIVNVSSQASMVGLENHAVYCASKAALDQLTRVMALELGPHQIRVNSVNPTVTNTEMAKPGWSDPVKAAAMKAKIPLGKFCEPENVVDCILFLLSDKAEMVNGVIFPIDGGFTAT